MISGVKKSNTDKQKGLFYVEQILKHRVEKGKTLYFVKWVGYGPEANSWEPADNFFNPELVRKYEQRLKMETEGRDRDEVTCRKKRHQDNLTATSRKSDRVRNTAHRHSLVDSISEDSDDNSSNLEQRKSQNFESVTMPLKRGRRGGYHRNSFLQPKTGGTSSSILLPPKSTISNLPLHPYNGLIGEEIDDKRIQQLTREMDEALEKLDGFLIIDESYNYYLSRLILIAKRPLGMVCYCRIVHKYLKRYLFECVPLDVFIAKYKGIVLDYLEEEIKADMLEKRRACENRNVEEVDNHSS